MGLCLSAEVHHKFLSLSDSWDRMAFSHDTLQDTCFPCSRSDRCRIWGNPRRPLRSRDPRRSHKRCSYPRRNRTRPDGWNRLCDRSSRSLPDPTGECGWKQNNNEIIFKMGEKITIMNNKYKVAKCFISRNGQKFKILRNQLEELFRLH